MLIRFFSLSFFAITLIILLSSSTEQASESELSKLMRVMADDMKKMKSSVDAGKPLKKWGKAYEEIKTATPSAESKKGEHFQEYANSFLTQVNRMKVAETNLDLRPQYNLLVQTCIRCHETYCPGPISMLRKLKLPERK
ncbi:MAG: hypothetical protein WED33_08690 [Bacteroidia bacterium]